MPLEVRTEGVQYEQHPHAHLLDVAGPLGDGLFGRVHQQIEAVPAVHQDDDAQLPGDGQHQVVVGDVQQVIKHAVRPNVGGVLAAGRAKTTLARVRHELGVLASGAAVDVTAQGRRAASENLSDVLEDHRPDPHPGRLGKLPPVGGQDGGDPVADARSRPEHAHAGQQARGPTLRPAPAWPRGIRSASTARSPLCSEERPAPRSARR